MEYRDIRALAVKRGVTWATIAQAYGCSVQHVSCVARGTRDSPAVRRAIARALGISVREIFPDYRPSSKKEKGI